MTKKEFFILVIISILFFIFINRDNKWWYYSAIGDEYAFYSLAKNVAQNKLPVNLVTFFRQGGVYSTVPFLSSFYQGLVMKIFGTDIVGWKISQIIIIILSFFPLYLLAKKLFNKDIALISILIFASSHYLWAYVKTGYCNIESIFPAVTSLFFYYSAVKNNKPLLLFFSGLFAGLGFFTYYPSRVIILILFFLNLLLKHKETKLSFLYILIGFLILVLPFVAINQTQIIKTMFDQSLISSNEARSIPRYLLLLKNISTNSLAFFANNHVGPYTSGSLIDPLSGILLIIGIAITIISYKKFRYQFILVWFILSFITVGVFSKYSNPAINRLNFLLPIISLFGAIALYKLMQIFNINLLRKIIIFAVLFFIFVLNYRRFYLETPKKYQSTPEAVIIRGLQERCLNKKTLIIYSYYEPLLQPAIEAYNLKRDVKFIKNEDFNKNLINQFDCLIVRKLDDENSKKILEELSKKNLAINEVTDFSGLTKIYLAENVQ